MAISQHRAAIFFGICFPFFLGNFFPFFGVWNFLPSFLPSFPSFPPCILPSFPPSLLSSFPPFLLPSFPPFLLPSFPPSFLPSLLPSFLPSLLSSFPPFLLPSFLPSFLSSFPPFLLPSFPPYFLPSFLPACLPSFLLRTFLPPENGKKFPKKIALQIQYNTNTHNGSRRYILVQCVEKARSRQKMRPRGMDIASQRHRFELHQGQREVMRPVSSHHTLQKSSRGVTGHPNSLGPQWRLLQWHQWYRCSCHQVILWFYMMQYLFVFWSFCLASCEKFRETETASHVSRRNFP